MNAVPLLARHWPFANGAGRLMDKFAKGIDFGSGERTTRTSDGVNMSVLADDLIGRHILMSGRFDHSIVRVLFGKARPGDVMLDIGANIGYVSTCFLASVPDSHVICIEPQPGIVNLLLKNVEQFGERATVHQVALSDAPGELRFHIDTANRGASMIADDGEISVRAIDAAELLGNLDKLNLIKIDVEGHELPVFRAMEENLRRLKPRAILFEDKGDAAAPDGAIGAILARCGYRVLGIDKRLLKTRLVPVRRKTDCRFNDYIAVLD